MNPRELKSISKEIGVDGDGIRCREAGGAAGRVLVPLELEGRRLCVRRWEARGAKRSVSDTPALRFPKTF